MSVLVVAILTYAGVAAAQLNGDEFSRPLGFALVEQTFGDVRQALGPAEMRQTGHDGNAEWRLCYYFPTSRTQVTFKTSDLGGQERDLLGVELARVPTAAATGCLVVSAAVEASTRLRVGPLRLGMSRDAYDHALGGAGRLEDGSHGRVFLRHQSMTSQQITRSQAPADQAYWDVQTVVGAEFSNNVIARLEVWRTVTN